MRSDCGDDLVSGDVCRGIGIDCLCSGKGAAVMVYVVVFVVVVEW